MTRIRLVRTDDITSIANWTSDTFDWGDYVSDSLNDWLAEETTAVPAIVDDDDRVVALARVRMVGAREGWLSAARVHPDHRRLGLASALNDWCVDWVASRGGAIVRLQIETWNEAAQGQVEKLGFRPVANVVNARLELEYSPMEPATNGGKRPRPEEQLQRSSKSEAPAAFIAWSTSDLARASHGLLAVEAWAWKRMVASDVLGSNLWECAAGWAIIDEHPDGMEARWLVCGPEEASRLVAAVIHLARARQAPHLNVAIPNVDWLAAPLEARGCDFFESYIYEKVVSAG